MKTYRITFLIALSILISLALFGCVTKSVDPSTGQTVYSADTGTIHSNTATAQGVAGIVAPLAGPYAPLVSPSIEAVGWIAALISGLIATSKTKQANTAKAVNKTMASGIVAANAQDAVLKVASVTPHFAEVAEHINNQTP